MPHQIVSIEVENWDIVFISIKPFLVFWDCDIDLFELELRRKSEKSFRNPERLLKEFE